MIPPDPDSATSPASFGFFSAKVAVLVALLAVAAGALFYVSRPERPDEANRARTLQGMSMVKPQGWYAIPHVGGPSERFSESLTIRPRAWQGIEPTLFAHALRKPPTPDELASQNATNITFEGETVPSRYYHHTHQTSRDVIVSRSGRYFEVGLLVPGEDVEPQKNDLWAFVETFRYDPPPSEATRPALPQLGPTLSPDQSEPLQLPDDKH